MKLAIIFPPLPSGWAPVFYSTWELFREILPTLNSMSMSSG